MEVMIKKKPEIHWLLAGIVTAFILIQSYAAAREKVTYLPIVSAEPQLYEIGDTGPAGGIVFWISSDGRHGLEAAASDQSAGIRWSFGVNFVTNAVRNGFNAGQYNTERIINIHGAGDYAAQLCANYKYGGYGDWYLPSWDELNLLYLKKQIVGGFKEDTYWSSTERYGDQVWAVDFSNGYSVASTKDSTRRVRPIRAFNQ